MTNFQAFGPDFSGTVTATYGSARRQLISAVKALEWSLDQEKAIELIQEKAGTEEPFTIMIGFTFWGVKIVD